MDERVEYIHLPAGSDLPQILPEPRRIMVLVHQEVATDWQNAVSDWIVESGCLYMVAWGRDCSSWDDSVDRASVAKFGYGDIPDEHFVMTTWHDDEPLHEVFFYARMCAFHPTVELPLLTILDISPDPRKAAILALHQAEASGLLEDALEDPRDLPFRERVKILMRK